MAVIDDLTLNTDISVPPGVALVVTSGKKLTVNSGSILDLTGGGLVLDDNTTLTVNGTVNTKGSRSSNSFGIVLMPGAMPNGVTITSSSNGTIYLRTPGTLLSVDAGQKLTLSGGITLDGLDTAKGDPTDNDGHMVFVRGELVMTGGKITGNYSTNTTRDDDGSAVEVNKGESSGPAIFTMSGGEISGNKTNKGGGGVNVVHGATFNMSGGKISGNTAEDGGGGVRINQGSYGATTFTMSGNAEISGNTTNGNGGGVWVRDGGDFIMEGGTVDDTNTASGGGKALYVDTGRAKWGDSTSSRTIGGNPDGSAGDPITLTSNGVDGTIAATTP